MAHLHFQSNESNTRIDAYILENPDDTSILHIPIVATHKEHATRILVEIVLSAKVFQTLFNKDYLKDLLSSMQIKLEMQKIDIKIVSEEDMPTDTDELAIICQTILSIDRDEIM